MKKRIIAAACLIILTLASCQSKDKSKTVDQKSSSQIVSSSSVVESSVPSNSSEVSSSSSIASTVSSKKSSSSSKTVSKKSTSTSTAPKSSSTVPVQTNASILKVFNDAYDKSDALVNKEYHELQKINMTLAGSITFDTNIDHHIVKNTDANNKMYFDVDSTTKQTFFGQTETTTESARYLDGNYYTLENNTLTKVSQDEYLATFPDVLKTQKIDTLPDITDSDITNLNKTADTNGMTTINFQIKDSVLNTYMKQMMGDSLEGSNFSFTNIEVTGKIDKNGYMFDFLMKFTMNGSIELPNENNETQSSTFSSNAQMQTVYSNPGTKPVVTSHNYSVNP